MKEFNFKVFYYDAHEKLMAKDVIHQVAYEPDYEMAYEFASLMAESHHPECVRIEVCLIADKKKTSVLAH